MNYKIERLEKRDVEELCDLLRLVFKRDSDYVLNKTKWAFENDHSCVLVAKDNGKIIGCRGGIEWKLKYNFENINAIQFHGTSVHPDYRRMGLFTNLNKAYLEYANQNNFEAIFNVSVNASRLGYEKLGWKYIKGFHRLTYFNKPFKYLLGVIDKSMPVREKLDYVDISEKITLDFIESRDEQFKDLVHTSYSEFFLDWRLDNRQENYRVYKDKDIFVIYKIEKNSRGVAVVLGDFFLMNKSLKLFSKAFKAIMEIEKPVITYTYLSENHPYFNYYLYNLFVPNPLNYHLNFGTKKLNHNNKIENRNWSMSFLDIDTF